MLIAGCLNQARRIVEKYDEVLFGPAPEELVVGTHGAIRELLCSEECQEFLSAKDSKEDASVTAGDNFVKKIVETVSPILPIALRNKSLDGSYFRTALHLLGATEFLFAQYEKDIRVQANPAGFVGLSTAMHGELERTTIWNEELKGFRDFMRDMKTQYQTSYGLGLAFANDASQRNTRRSRNSQRRAGWHNHSSLNFQGFGNGSPQLHQLQAARGRGRGAFGTNRGNVSARLARGPCYDFRAGTCGRGDTCRYSHSN